MVDCSHSGDDKRGMERYSESDFADTEGANVKKLGEVTNLNLPIWRVWAWVVWSHESHFAYGTSRMSLGVYQVDMCVKLVDQNHSGDFESPLVLTAGLLATLCEKSWMKLRIWLLLQSIDWGYSGDKRGLECDNEV